MQQLRIGSYNVKDFIAPSQGRGIRQPKSHQELSALADTIKESGCDIIALQEVGSKELLKRFIKGRLGDEYPHVSFVPGNDRSGLNLAVISKYPISNVVSHRKDRFLTADGSSTTQFVRDVVRTDVNVQGETVAIYNTHGKARLGNPATEEQRIAEARAGREILLQDMQAFPAQLVLVAGDMNDETHNRSVQALARGDGQGPQMVDSLADKSSEEKMTWMIPGESRSGRLGLQFDHLLYPEHLQGCFLGSQVHSQANNAGLASDHYLVSADFLIRTLPGEA